MELFLATWPNLSFTLVSAESESHARFKLDRLGPPSAAKVTVWEGEVFLDFDINLKASSDSEYPSVNGAPDPDTELLEEVLAFGFPHLHSYYRAVWRGEKKASLREAKAAWKLDRDTFPDSSPPDVPEEEVAAALERVFGDLGDRRSEE